MKSLSHLWLTFIFKMTFCSFLLSSLLFSSQAMAVDQRQQKNMAAQKALLELNFFHNGRGMILPPGFPPLSAENPLTRLGLIAMTKHLQNQYGVIVHQGRVTGFSQTRFEGIRVGVIGCAMCHTGKAAGIFIPGLGNKNFDLGWLAINSKKYLNFFDRISDGDPLNRRPEVVRFLKSNSEQFLKNVSHPDLINQTQGLVPIGLIRKWFFDNQQIPMDSWSRGQVKIPAFWGYGEKRKVGSFSDGFGDGQKPGWAVAVELVAGQTPEGVREYEHKLEVAEGALADLLPPKYPFEIDVNKAYQGEKLFAAKCAGCHGSYAKDAEGYPVYQAPIFIPWDRVRTDNERLSGVTDLFKDLVARNPLNDLIQQAQDDSGYFAPRLVGVWARFPYLHNASVPTIFDLLKRPEERPKKFSLWDSGEKYRFDSKKLGLTQATVGAGPERWVYDTEKLGHGNVGHYFESFDSMTDEHRLEIIEYLKTL